MRISLPLLVLAASTVGPVLGGCPHPAPPPPPVVKAPPTPPPKPPVCVKVGQTMSAVGSPTADDHSARFCVSDGESNACYAVGLDGGGLTKEDGPSPAQPTALGDVHARVDTTEHEVKVCVGKKCRSYKPRVPRNVENPLDAVAGADGSLSVVLLGDAEEGKGVAEVWDVKKGRRVARIRYSKGDYKCGHARVLGQTIYISADVCAGPAAHAWLFNTRGRRLADVGGKQFGTWGTEPVQVDGTVWAFLEENGGSIALQDVKTGKVVKTIDIGAAWMPADAAPAATDGEPAAAGADDEKAGDEKAGYEKAGDEKAGDKGAGGEKKAKRNGKDKAEAAAAAPSLGNPGESALVRGPAGKLVVITGGPTPGNVAIVDTASGEVKVLHARDCAAGEGKTSAPAADAAAPADEAPKADDKKADDKKADDEKADDKNARDEKAGGKKAGGKKAGAAKAR